MDSYLIPTMLENLGQPVSGERTSVFSQEQFLVFRVRPPVHNIGRQHIGGALMETDNLLLLPGNMVHGGKHRSTSN